MEGRLLPENTVLASELVNGYHKNKGSKKITIKVDIVKAFDTLSWEFLFASLESFDLPVPFIYVLKACVCTTRFKVGYNGTVNGFLKESVAFVKAKNCLSLMLNQEAHAGRLSYHYKCHKTRLTHLSFADDLLIFIDGSIESVQTLLKILHEF